MDECGSTSILAEESRCRPTALSVGKQRAQSSGRLDYAALRLQLSGERQAHSTSIKIRQWSLDPHSPTAFSARAVTCS